MKKLKVTISASVEEIEDRYPEGSGSSKMNPVVHQLVFEGYSPAALSAVSKMGSDLIYGLSISLTADMLGLPPEKKKQEVAK